MNFGDPTPAALQRPPLPSITGSALQESRLLLELTRRVLGAWLARG